MKLSLVVAQGVHEGKTIAIPVAQFVIGRDEGCQLRPSSPAISKKHCGLFVTGEQVVVRDMGSTNGTFVNDKQITGDTELHDGDRLKAGPLEFVVRIAPATKSATPAPTKSLGGKTPAPPATAPAAETKSERASKEEEDHDKMAALLLATDDGPAGPLTPSDIPDGTTAFEMPAVDPNNPNQKPGEKAPAAPAASTRDAADAILRKYMRRPRA